MQRSAIAAAVAVGMLSSSSSSLQAAELYWQGGSGALTDANYTDGVTTNLTPGGSDFLDLGENGVITHSAVSSFGRLRVGHPFTGGQATGGDPGPATLTVTGGSINVGGASNFVQGINAGLVVGFNSAATLNISAGSVTSTRHVVIGHDDPDTVNNVFTGSGTATLKLSGTGSLRSNLENMRVGHGNVGVVTIEDDAELNVVSASLSAASAPDLSVGALTASTFTQSSGTTRIANSFLIGSGSTVTISGGTLTTKYQNAANGYTTVAGAGNIQIGRNGSTGDTLSISGANTVVNIGNRFLLGSAGAGGINTLVEQSGGAVTSALAFVVSDTGGNSTYELSGGSLTVNAELSRVGRIGSGVMTQTGGVADFKAGLAVGDDATTAVGDAVVATGLYEISSGELHATNGSASIVALGIGSQGNGSGTNAAADASGGTGTLRVIGDDALIDVNGGFRVANVEGAGTLAYQLESGDGLSMIDVSGNAIFDLGSNLVLDASLASPTQTVYDLLTAVTITDNGLVLAAPAGWTHQIVSGGNGQILQVVVPEPSMLGLVAAAGLLAVRRPRRVGRI